MTTTTSQQPCTTNTTRSRSINARKGRSPETMLLLPAMMVRKEATRSSKVHVITVANKATRSLNVPTTSEGEQWRP